LIWCPSTSSWSSSCGSSVLLVLVLLVT
jgi:hypothetical protein